MPDDSFFSIPVEPDEDETMLSFDRLREVFSNFSDEESPELPSRFILQNNDETESIGTGAADTAPLNTYARVSTLPKTTVSDNTCDDTFETAISDLTLNGPCDGESALETDENGEPYEPMVPSEDRCELSPCTIFEAMLFVGDRENRPLQPERAAELMRNVSPEELVDIVYELNHRYLGNGLPYHIVKDGDGYRMVLRPEFEAVRSRFYGKVRETRLSQAAVDVLAIVAYQQPISAEEVQKFRKAPCQSVLSQLVRRELLETQRILQKKRSVTLYRTTERFLQLFQIESLDDLPTAEEIDFR